MKIPLKEVNDGNVHFFTYKSGGKNINFFVRMDGAGKLHTHFDACYTCSKYHKGYRCEGTDIVCNECNTRFKLSEEEWRDVGGCMPISLPHIENSGSLIVRIDDLKRGSKLF